MARLLLITILLATLAGCRAAAPSATGPARIAADRYRPVYEAATEVLRDYDFRLARQDYRFGELATYPRGAPTALEAWEPDNTTAQQAIAASFQDLRRIARVFLVPVQTDGDAADSAEYDVRVEVLIEQRQMPVRRLSGSTRRVFSRLDEVPAELEERGIDATYWRPLRRDPYLERRLLRDILDRAGEQPG
ncbi:MAG: hypothetical protein ACLFV3_09915 [Phycisphaeraceae bacterium]